MKKIIILALLLLMPGLASSSTFSERLLGRILLSVEENGEAWYVNPSDGLRYYLGRPDDAFNLMRHLGVGISEENFQIFKAGVPQKFSGKILLRPEANGESYYVNPLDRQMYFLGRPANAFDLMRRFGLGISKSDLSQIRREDQRTEYIDYQVPFTPQAPQAQWSNPVFQDGCEEASSLMAVYWALGKDFADINVSSEIISISDWEEKNIGEYRDVSVADTAVMIKSYFNYDNIEVSRLESADDLVELIGSGVIIAPANGQLLGNTYFTPPGPINHMLVIKGYNPSNETFITNDPGTRRGADYIYDKNVLYEAIRDYPTGYHLPNNDINKYIILVKSQSI